MQQAVIVQSPTWGGKHDESVVTKVPHSATQERCMRQDIVARQAKAMREAGLDAIVSSSPENFAYGTGYPSPTQSLMRWRHAMALVTANAEVSLRFQ